MAGAQDKAREHEQSPGSWREIYDRHVGAVRRLCAGFAEFSAADVEDLVQETFVQAFENIDQLQDPAKLRPWLLVIARSRCLKRVRGRGIERRHLDGFEADPAVGAPVRSVVLLESVLEADRRTAIVREMLESLPEGPEGETVRLFYVEGTLSAREIAERQGLGKSTVTMRLERFRAKIKRRLVALLAKEDELP